MAGRHDISVPNGSVFALGLDAGDVDPLNAVGTFFHHAAGANGDIRVGEELGDGRVEICVLKEVESPYLVGTVVGAIPSTDTAVVHHFVQPFRAMCCGAHRTNRLTGCTLAMHARYGLV